MVYQQFHLLALHSFHLNTQSILYFPDDTNTHFYFYIYYLIFYFFVALVVDILCDTIGMIFIIIMYLGIFNI